MKFNVWYDNYYNAWHKNNCWKCTGKQNLNFQKPEGLIWHRGNYSIWNKTTCWFTQNKKLKRWPKILQRWTEIGIA